MVGTVTWIKHPFEANDFRFFLVFTVFTHKCPAVCVSASLPHALSLSSAHISCRLIYPLFHPVTHFCALSIPFSLNHLLVLRFSFSLFSHPLLFLRDFIRLCPALLSALHIHSTSLSLSLSLCLCLSVCLFTSQAYSLISLLFCSLNLPHPHPAATCPPAASGSFLSFLTQSPTLGMAPKSPLSKAALGQLRLLWDVWKKSEYAVD